MKYSSFSFPQTFKDIKNILTCGPRRQGVKLDLTFWTQFADLRFGSVAGSEEVGMKSLLEGPPNLYVTWLYHVAASSSRHWPSGVYEEAEVCWKSDMALYTDSPCPVLHGRGGGSGGSRRSSLSGQEEGMASSFFPKAYPEIGSP